MGADGTGASAGAEVGNMPGPRGVGLTATGKGCDKGAVGCADIHEAPESSGATEIPDTPLHVRRGVAKNVVIVESPAKAKTIEKYMGKDYKVLASMGHVRDLPKSSFAIEINGGVKLDYEALAQPSSKKAVAAIKKAIKEAETVWLAPDPDREGEAIAWHVAELVKLDPAITPTRHVQRDHEASGYGGLRAAAFHRHEPRRRSASTTRRRPDRWLQAFALAVANVGPNLSAGRVQSAALLILVEREREIRAFKPREYWDLTAALVDR